MSRTYEYVKRDIIKDIDTAKKITVSILDRLLEEEGAPVTIGLTELRFALEGQRVMDTTIMDIFYGLRDSQIVSQNLLGDYVYPPEPVTQ